MLFVFWLFLCENLSIDFNKKKTVVHLEGFNMLSLYASGSKSILKSSSDEKSNNSISSEYFLGK